MSDTRLHLPTWLEAYALGAPEKARTPLVKAAELLREQHTWQDPAKVLELVRVAARNVEAPGTEPWVVGLWPALRALVDELRGPAAVAEAEAAAPAKAGPARKGTRNG